MQSDMADLISIRKLLATERQPSSCSEAQDDKIETENCKKRGRFHLKRFCKLPRPKSKRCVYEILKKAIKQSKVMNKERFRWIRRVKFILDEVSEVHEYEVESDAGSDDVDEFGNSELQDILLFLNDEVEVCSKTEEDCSLASDEIVPTENDVKDDSIVPKLISYTSIESIDGYFNFKNNIERIRHSSISNHLDEEKSEDLNDSESFEGDIELLLTKYFQNVEL